MYTPPLSRHLRERWNIIKIERKKTITNIPKHTRKRKRKKHARMNASQQNWNQNRWNTPMKEWNNMTLVRNISQYASLLYLPSRNIHRDTCSMLKSVYNCLYTYGMNPLRRKSHRRKERSPKVNGMFLYFCMRVSAIWVFGDFLFGDEVHNPF